MVVSEKGVSKGLAWDLGVTGKPITRKPIRRLMGMHTYQFIHTT